MDETFVFQPDRRQGVWFHLAALVFLGLIGLASLWLAARAAGGPALLVYVLPALVALAAGPLVAYRLISLRGSAYMLERDGLLLRWGLRVEQIPMDQVLWVQPADEAAPRLPLPLFRWPGAVRGYRHAPELGEVEFMAVHGRNLILIATPGRVYAISPADPEAFLQAFERCTEMGSLAPLQKRSVYPTVLLERIWRTQAARWLILAGGGFSMALLIWASVAASGRAEVAFGFQPNGTPGEPAPAVRLMLLPVANTFFYLVDLLVGMFFFRKEGFEPMAYVLWVCGAVTPLAFLLAIVFMLG